jgi:hypothetical protein
MEKPRRHMSEVVEESMQKEGKKALKNPHQDKSCGPTIKIVINTGPQPMPMMLGPKKHGNPHKPKHNPPAKKLKKKGVSGPMESALKAAY